MTFIKTYPKERIITNAMILNYSLYKLREQLLLEKKLIFKYGKMIDSNGEFLFNFSFVDVKENGKIFLAKHDNEYYYNGKYPGDLFFGEVELRFRKDFSIAIPALLEAHLRQVLETKTNKIVDFYRGLDDELFKL